MTIVGRLFGRKPRIGPAEMADLAMSISHEHFLSLIGDVGEGVSDRQWADVTCELMRAHFALACLRAGDSISDERALTGYRKAMLDVLRHYQEGKKVWKVVRAAFADKVIVDYCHDLYLQGRPAEEDLLAARDCANLLRLNFGDPVLMLYGYAQVRTARYLGIGKPSVEFMQLWALNVASFSAAWKNVLSKLEMGSPVSSPPPSPSETPASVRWSTSIAVMCMSACSWNVLRHGEPFLGAALFWGGLWFVGSLLCFFFGYIRGR